MFQTSDHQFYFTVHSIFCSSIEIGKEVVILDKNCVT